MNSNPPITLNLNQELQINNPTPDQIEFILEDVTGLGTQFEDAAYEFFNTARDLGYNVTLYPNQVILHTRIPSLKGESYVERFNFILDIVKSENPAANFNLVNAGMSARGLVDAGNTAQRPDLFRKFPLLNRSAEPKDVAYRLQQVFEFPIPAMPNKTNLDILEAVITRGFTIRDDSLEDLLASLEITLDNINIGVPPEPDKVAIDNNEQKILDLLEIIQKVKPEYFSGPNQTRFYEAVQQLRRLLVRIVINQKLQFVLHELASGGAVNLKNFSQQQFDYIFGNLLAKLDNEFILEVVQVYMIRLPDPSAEKNLVRFLSLPNNGYSPIERESLYKVFIDSPSQYFKETDPNKKLQLIDNYAYLFGKTPPDPETENLFSELAVLSTLGISENDIKEIIFDNNLKLRRFDDIRVETANRLKSKLKFVLINNKYNQKESIGYGKSYSFLLWIIENSNAALEIKFFNWLLNSNMNFKTGQIDELFDYVSTNVNRFFDTLTAPLDPDTERRNFYDYKIENVIIKNISNQNNYASLTPLPSPNLGSVQPKVLVRNVGTQTIAVGEFSDDGSIPELTKDFLNNRNLFSRKLGQELYSDLMRFISDVLRNKGIYQVLVELINDEPDQTGVNVSKEIIDVLQNIIANNLNARAQAKFDSVRNKLSAMLDPTVQGLRNINDINQVIASKFIVDILVLQTKLDAAASGHANLPNEAIAVISDIVINKGEVRRDKLNAEQIAILSVEEAILDNKVKLVERIRSIRAVGGSLTPQEQNKMIDDFVREVETYSQLGGEVMDKLAEIIDEGMVNLIREKGAKNEVAEIMKAIFKRDRTKAIKELEDLINDAKTTPNIDDLLEDLTHQLENLGVILGKRYPVKKLMNLRFEIKDAIDSLEDFQEGSKKVAEAIRKAIGSGTLILDNGFIDFEFQNSQNNLRNRLQTEYVNLQGKINIPNNRLNIVWHIERHIVLDLVKNKELRDFVANYRRLNSPMNLVNLKKVYAFVTMFNYPEFSKLTAAEYARLFQLIDVPATVYSIDNIPPLNTFSDRDIAKKLLIGDIKRTLRLRDEKIKLEGKQEELREDIRETEDLAKRAPFGDKWRKRAKTAGAVLSAGAGVAAGAALAPVVAPLVVATAGGAAVGLALIRNIKRNVYNDHNQNELTQKIDSVNQKLKSAAVNSNQYVNTIMNVENLGGNKTDQIEKDLEAIQSKYNKIYGRKLLNRNKEARDRLENALIDHKYLKDSVLIKLKDLHNLYRNLNIGYGSADSLRADIVRIEKDINRMMKDFIAKLKEDLGRTGLSTSEKSKILSELTQVQQRY